MAASQEDGSLCLAPHLLLLCRCAWILLQLTWCWYSHYTTQHRRSHLQSFYLSSCLFGSLHLFTIQIHYSIQNTQWPYGSIFLHSIPEVHRPFLYQQCCINYCTWDRHSYNEALLLEEARCRQFRQFPVMGLTLGQMLCDVFAAVKGCFMLFLCQSSCPQKDRLSKRSKRAKINPSYSISDLLPLV